MYFLTWSCENRKSKIENIMANTTQTRFFKVKEEHRILKSVRQAESVCSGEIRVFVEDKCPETVERRTIEVFKNLKMFNTQQRNGVLIYIALTDKKFAVFGDEGIHQHLGFHFWRTEAAYLRDFFEQDMMVDGLCHVIKHLGDVMQPLFPHQNNDANELPDEIVYG